MTAASTFHAFESVTVFQSILQGSKFSQRMFSESNHLSYVPVMKLDHSHFLDLRIWQATIVEHLVSWVARVSLAPEPLNFHDMFIPCRFVAFQFDVYHHREQRQHDSISMVT